MERRKNRNNLLATFTVLEEEEKENIPWYTEPSESPCCGASWWWSIKVKRGSSEEEVNSLGSPLQSLFHFRWVGGGRSRRRGSGERPTLWVFRYNCLGGVIGFNGHKFRIR